MRIPDEAGIRNGSQHLPVKIKAHITVPIDASRGEVAGKLIGEVATARETGIRSVPRGGTTIMAQIYETRSNNAEVPVTVSVVSFDDLRARKQQESRRQIRERLLNRDQAR
jgi:hypothetical protein